MLLLGVDHGSNTSLHLAEYRVPVPPREASGAAVPGPDGRRWATWEDVVADETDFAAAGRGVRRDRRGRDRPASGEGEARLMRQRDAVAFAVDVDVEHARR